MEQANAALARIFLTEADSLESMVPLYWRPCVRSALLKTNKNCRFTPELFAVPGISSKSTNPTMPPQSSGTVPSLDDPVETISGRPVPIGGDVKPPKALYQPEPEFNDIARSAKYQGVVTLALVVDKDGMPRRIRIINPIGAGLDAKAVEAVRTWKFEPANKNGNLVPTQIVVEVDFHLY